jgi:hypothetical protein
VACDSGEEYEIGYSEKDVESGRDECGHKNRKFRLTKI